MLFCINFHNQTNLAHNQQHRSALQSWSMEAVDVNWIYLSNFLVNFSFVRRLLMVPIGFLWVLVCFHQYFDLSILKYERFALNYFAWNTIKGLILFSMNDFWYMFMIYCTALTLIGDNRTLRHSSLEFKVNFCQDKIFAKEILWKVKRSKISTNSPYISILRLLKSFDNWQKLEDNQRQRSTFKHQIPPQLNSIKIDTAN